MADEESHVLDVDADALKQPKKQAMERTAKINEASTSQQEIPELSLNDTKLLDILEKQDDTRSSTQNCQNTKIQSVPEMLRKDFRQYYEPRAIAIGPIHHSASDSLPLTEKFKWKLAARFIKASRNPGKMLLGKVKAKIEELKEWFDEKVIEEFDDETLARMLFLDGCSVLQFIHSFVHDRLEELEINNGQATLAQQDFFLLENQIPFQVLTMLMDLSHDKHDLRRSVAAFVYKNIMAPPPSDGSKLHLGDFHSPLHLLDFLHSTVVFGDFHDKKIDDCFHSCLTSCDSFLKICGTARVYCDFIVFSCIPAMLCTIYALMTCLFPKCSIPSLFPKWPTSYHRYRPSFRNVQEVKTAGIKFKPSDKYSMKAISFSPGWFGITGVLKLPPLIVDDSMTRKLWNLIAYEMCPDYYRKDYEVTAYVSFLDSLIDTEQDVKDLRSVHIIWNRLSSDAKVAQLFNTIGSNLVPDDKSYFEVKAKIQRHCKRRYAVWIAQATQDYFSSPWTILALSAALTALLLTAVQTWYAIHPKA